MKPFMLFTAINRAGALFIWPVPLPGPGGRRNPWHESHMKGAEVGMVRWVRIEANMAAGMYDVMVAQGALPDPEWPDLDFGAILKLAFGFNVIDSADHPVVRRLRGSFSASLSPLRRPRSSSMERQLPGRRSPRPPPGAVRGFLEMSTSDRLSHYREILGRGFRVPRARRRSARTRCAWWRGSCASAGSCGCGRPAPRLRAAPFPTRGHPVRGLLRQGRAGVLPRAGLADATPRPRPLRGVPGRDQRPPAARGAASWAR